MSIQKPSAEELREMYFLFGQKEAAPRQPYIPDLLFSDAEQRELLGLLNQTNKKINPAAIAKELTDAGRYFPDALCFQGRQSKTELAAKFRDIETAARRLLLQLGIPRGGSATDIPHNITAWLQMAASDYGIGVGLPPGTDRTVIPWNFWEAYKVPAVVAHIALLEHWATIAQQKIRQTSEPPDRRASNRGATAMRMLVHRLGLLWLHSHGSPPTVSMTSEGPEGAFMDFALPYLQVMRRNVTPEHRRYVPTIDAELTFQRRRPGSRTGRVRDIPEESRMREGIYGHLRTFRARIDPSLMGRSTRKKK